MATLTRTSLLELVGLLILLGIRQVLKKAIKEVSKANKNGSRVGGIFQKGRITNQSFNDGVRRVARSDTLYMLRDCPAHDNLNLTQP